MVEQGEGDMNSRQLGDEWGRRDNTQHACRIAPWDCRFDCRSDEREALLVGYQPNLGEGLPNRNPLQSV